MPAIQPVRLKLQAARLAEKFYQPKVFARGLTFLIEEYADHTQHHGQAGEPAPLLPSSNIPAPVLRQVWLELYPCIKSEPQASLILCDTLWQQAALEHRIIAADILGHLPTSYHNEIITRVQSWMSAGIEDRLIDILLERGLSQLRSQAPQIITELIERWLSSNDKINKQLGLRLLHSLASDATFADLPVLYRLLTPFLRIAPPYLRPEILLILSSLINRSAAETAYLLRQNLTAVDNPDTAWLLRQVITEFPPDLRVGLREALRRK